MEFNGYFSLFIGFEVAMKQVGAFGQGEGCSVRATAKMGYNAMVEAVGEKNLI